MTLRDWRKGHGGKQATSEKHKKVALLRFAGAAEEVDGQRIMRAVDASVPRQEAQPPPRIPLKKSRMQVQENRRGGVEAD